jgi:hypothetical protein
MNQPLVESVAQTILAMSDEERQLLESTLQHSKTSSQIDEPTEAVKTFRVAEIAQDIKTFEGKYHAPQLTDEQGLGSENGEFIAVEQAESSLFKNSFLRTAASLNLEGPEDFSVNIDHYLYGLPKRDV